MRLKFGNGAAHHGTEKHRAEKFEHLADIATIGGIVLLGLAMVIGLIMADGSGVPFG
ncbi:MAG: hypothetical protein IT546_10580 [Caulobacteraceae bacterium]|nr:hypothetical protein [Caulobacteraceae bacterium]